jgi:hypothetical protein
MALVGAALMSGIICIGLLTAFSSASEGPIGIVLDRLGTTVGSVEHALRQRFGGLGRSGDLAWFTPYRNDLGRLRHPDVVLLGAYDSDISETLQGVVHLERSLGTTLPLVQTYAAWGDKPEQRFPLQLATTIWDMGSVPVITWEPWLTDFENARHPGLPLRESRDRHGMVSVARGDYDFYVDAWAADAARFGKPLFLRFAHEMNDPYRYPWGPQNNTKEEFIAAWQHVVGRFRRAGVHNVIWVWSPHVAYQYWDTYYPGGEYVDWVATGALNFGSVAHWSQWWAFRELFGMKYEPLASFDKPIMVAEFGSLAVGGDRTAWYRDALVNLPQKYPAVKALLFFQAKNDQTVTYQQVDWSIASEPALANAIAAAIHPWVPAASAR